MVKIKIKKVLIHNFQSFRDEEWDMSNTNRLVLVKGINKDTETTTGSTSNGAGKSSLANALMFGLFGQLGAKFHIANLKNKYANDSVDGFKMFVDVEVDTEVSRTDVKHWRIRRGIQKTQSATIQLFSLGEDGMWRDISKSSVANTQKFIDENVTMMSFEMYQRLVMLSIDDRYIFFKLNAGQRRDFVEMMFDTSIYTRMYQTMSSELKTRNLIVQNMKVNKVKCEKSKEVCEDEIEKYKSSVSAKIDESTAARESCQKQIDGFADKFSAISARMSEISESLSRIREGKRKLTNAVSELRNRITDFKTRIAESSSTISHHEREIDKHREVLGMVCDDCKKVVSNFYSLDAYRDEIERLQKEISENEVEIESINSKIEKVSEYETSLSEQEMAKTRELNDATVDSRNLTFQKTQLMNQMSSLERQIEELRESMDDESKIPSFSLYRQMVKELEETETGLQNEVSNICHLKVGSDIVSPESIRKNIISKVVESMNNMINANLSELGVGFTCTISPDMDDYTINSEGGELDFTNLSMGERMKLVISSQLAFRKFLISRFNVCANVMIIDEVVDRALDSVSIQKLLGMLLQLSQKENTNISIISHRGEVERMFYELQETQTLVIQKENNISRILR